MPVGQSPRVRVSLHNSTRDNSIDVDALCERMDERRVRKNKNNRDNPIFIIDSDDECPAPAAPPPRKKQKQAHQHEPASFRPNSNIASTPTVAAHSASPNQQNNAHAGPSRRTGCTVSAPIAVSHSEGSTCTPIKRKCSTPSFDMSRMREQMPGAMEPLERKPKRSKSYDSESSENDVDWDTNERWATPRPFPNKYTQRVVEITQTEPKYFTDDVFEKARNFKAVLREVGGRTIDIDTLLRSSGYTSLYAALRRGNTNFSIRNGFISSGVHPRADIATEVQLSNLRPSMSFMQSAGPISQIVQLGNREFIVTSNAVNGTVNSDPSIPEYDRERPDPYNNAGSLLYCAPSKVWIVNGHYRADDSRSGWETRPGKTYTVSAATIAPTSSNRIVTGGGDGNIVQWVVPNGENLDADDDDLDWSPLREDKRTKLQGVIYDLQFQPERHKALAASCGDGHVYIFREFCRSNDWVRLAISPNFESGSMVWGFGATMNLIFTLSEPDTEGGVFRGYHRAFDLGKGTNPVYELDVTDAGDTLCLNSKGDQLAVSTLTQDSAHSVRLYDVRRKDKRMTQMIQLEPFTLASGRHGDVNRMSFDPYDGVLLAIARSDNCVALYDSRYLSKGPLAVYRHEASRRPYVPQVGQSDGYGVFDFHWVTNPRTHRMSIVSGGEDGCVRLWDVGVDAQDSQTVIAQMEDDIAMLSIGDTAKGEYRLIAGDAGGRIAAFNNVLS